MRLNEFHDVEELEIIGDQAKSMHKDHEVQMARSELYKAAKSAMALHDMLKHLPEDANIEGWVQAKITKAADYLSSVKSYLEYEQHSTGEITVDEMMPAPVLGESKKRRVTEGTKPDFLKGAKDLTPILKKEAKKRGEELYRDKAGVLQVRKLKKKQGVAEGQINKSVLSTDEIEAINQYLDDEISFHQLKLGYPRLIGNAARQFDHKFRNEMDFYDRMVQARDEGDIAKPGVTEGEGMSLQQLATISDEALDNAYHYGRSTPGNSFGWQANLKSAEFAKKAIDSGVKDIEQISDAIHRGWNVTAQAFVKNPDQFDDRKIETAKRQMKEPNKSPEEIAKEVDALIEKKRAQRANLMKVNYAQLPEDEKEKDRVVARALLKALTGGIQETAGATGSGAMATSMGGGNGFKNGGPGTMKRESVMRKKGRT